MTAPGQGSRRSRLFLKAAVGLERSAVSGHSAAHLTFLSDRPLRGAKQPVGAGWRRSAAGQSNANFHQIEVGRSVALLLEARGRLRKRKIEHAKSFRRAMTQTARAKAGCRRCRGKPGITRNSCSAPESVGILPSRRNRIRNSRRSWGAAGSCSCGTRSRTGKRQSTWFPAGRIHSVGVEQAAVSPAAI
jgi:hypothetical protein